MTNANDKQIGGQHYKKAAFQPWDWPRKGLGHYETSAIQYLTRFRDKGGIEDLHKARHYVEKLIEVFVAGEYVNNCNANNLVVREYNKLNSCHSVQGDAIHLLVQWNTVEELHEVLKLIDELIARDSDTPGFVTEKDIPALLAEQPLPPHTGLRTAVNNLAAATLGLVTSSGTGVVEPREPPLLDVATAPLPPYKPLKPALKIPRSWHTDNDPDKLVE